MLFGLDLAKREIIRQRRVVVVEGYTDVMAMHLAGVTTAVASCGTAFGDEHITVLRRYLLDSQAGPGGIRAKDGTVVYTFDGDSAGRQAALKAFDSDQRFAANTFVAIEANGMDPCELRQAKGDEALRELVGGAKNLFEFAIQTAVGQHDLDSAEGRYAALNVGVPLVARIKDDLLRDSFATTLAMHAGTDIDETRRRVRRAAQQRAQRPDAVPAPRGRPERGDGDGRRVVARPDDPREPPDDAEPPPPDMSVPEALPDARDREFKAEREALKLALQQPALVAAAYGMVQPEVFKAPAYAVVHRAIGAAGGPGGDHTGPAWVDSVRGEVPDGPLRSLVSELAVERPEWPTDEVDARYAGSIIARLAERQAIRQELHLKSALQRAEAAGDSARARELNADLFEFTKYRLALTKRAWGDS